jgi:hypothetical protein
MSEALTGLKAEQAVVLAKLITESAGNATFAIALLKAESVDEAMEQYAELRNRLFSKADFGAPHELVTRDGYIQLLKALGTIIVEETAKMGGGA